MRAIDADNVLLRITSEKEDNWKSCKGKPNEYDIGVNNGLTLAHAIVLGTPTIEVPRWIPVTERLPEKSTDVLAYNGDYIFVSEYYTKQFGSIEVDMWRKPQCADDPTHWMPLPTPPKDGDT